MNSKKILLLGFLMCLGIQSVCAQELVINSFEHLQRDAYAQKNKRRDINNALCAVIRISVADAKDCTFEKNEIIGDPIYSSGEVIVYMPQGRKGFTIHSGKFGTKKINFVEINSNISKLSQGTTYRLELKVILPEDQIRRTLVMGSVGYHPAQLSYGAMVGMAAKHGGYVHVRTDFNSASAELQCNDTGALLSSGKLPYYKDGVTHEARLSVTGGYLYRMWSFLYAYVGAGYGYRTLAWETVDNELVENVDHSASGVAAEIGVIGTFKRFTLSVGCHALNFKYPELNVGIGYFF